MVTATTEPGSPKLPIRRNMALRASLLGFSYLVSGATCAGLTLLGGVALTAGGVAALAVVLVTIPALGILRYGPRHHASQLDDERRRGRPCTSTRGRLNLETTR